MASAETVPNWPAALSIPAQSDWTDYGPILEQGNLGDWDFKLFGAFAGCALKKDNTYFLYYQGACCYRIMDDSVTWRAIGVATSEDGVNFTSYAGNPVVSWWPTDGPEEGAMSCSLVQDASSGVVLYYSAGTEEAPTTITSEGRLATSSDGVSFADQGIALDHADPEVWGSGDELGPVMAIRESGLTRPRCLYQFLC